VTTDKVTHHASPVTRSVGVLGGTFDPIHFGHLRLGEEMAAALDLAEVRFLPSGTPPHRPPPVAPAAARRDMVRLAIADNPGFQLDEFEVFKTAPCYMVDTLAALRADLGPAAPLVLILGADAFAGLGRWHAWPRLFDLAHLAVAERPGSGDWQAALPAELAAVWRQRHTERRADLSDQAAGSIWRQPITALDISASRLRADLATGRSIRYLTPAPVIAYLHHHALYR